MRICCSTLEYVLVSCCCCNKYYKSSGLKQPKLILLQFWKPESKISFTKDKMSAGLVPSPGSMGRIHSLPFSASHGRLCSWPCDPFLHLQSISSLQPLLPSSHHLLFCGQIALCLSFIKTLVLAFRIHLGNSR